MTNVSAKRQMGEAGCDVKSDEYIAEGVQDADAQEQEDENEETGEEVLSQLDQALKEVRLYLDGKLKLKSAEEFLAELESEEGEE